MADNAAAGGATGLNAGSDAPNLKSTRIESGDFDEKVHTSSVDAQPPPNKTEDGDEDEDIDALIDELESRDGHEEEEDEQDTVPGQGRTVPEDMLQTDTRLGLTDNDVVQRRKKYGLNQMKEEKENLVLKFLGYFIGPIQFVMEVCFHSASRFSPSALYLRLQSCVCRKKRKKRKTKTRRSPQNQSTNTIVIGRLPRFSQQVSKTG